MTTSTERLILKALLLAALVLFAFAGCESTTPINIPVPAYTVTAQAVIGGPSVSVSVPAQIITIPAKAAPSATPGVTVLTPTKP
jgi:hypothetical protein